MCAGRDLLYLLGSYAINMSFVLSLLYFFRSQQVGVAGVWGCLLSFQVRLRSPQVVYVYILSCSMPWSQVTRASCGFRSCPGTDFSKHGNFLLFG